MRDLRQLVALVTGGSRGIGRALSLELAEAGATVYTCARSNGGLDETVEQFDGPGRLVTQTADVTRPEQIADLTDRIRSDEQRLDAVINNAGVLGPRSQIEDVSYESWRRTLEVNLDGVFLISKASIPLLRAAESGIIVNMSSSVGREGRAKWGPYAVSKHGVEGLTETLADELAEESIAVVSANPGGTATEMRADAYPDEDPETLPKPRRVAGTLRLLVASIGVDQSGRSYDCRDLFELAEAKEPPDPTEIPSAET